MTTIKEEPNEILSDEDKKARTDFDRNGRKGNSDSYRDTPRRERPRDPLPQFVLPPNPQNGKNTACFFRGILRIVEDLVGCFFTEEELNDIWDAAEESGVIGPDSYVNKPNELLRLALEAFGYGGGNPYFDNDPNEAIGSLIKLTRFGDSIESGAASVHDYERSMHAQTGNPDGTFSSDPWGRDLSSSFRDGRKVVYAHW